METAKQLSDTHLLKRVFDRYSFMRRIMATRREVTSTLSILNHIDRLNARLFDSKTKLIFEFATQQNADVATFTLAQRTLEAAAENLNLILMLEGVNLCEIHEIARTAMTGLGQLKLQDHNDSRLRLKLSDSYRVLEDCQSRISAIVARQRINLQTERDELAILEAFPFLSCIHR